MVMQIDANAWTPVISSEELFEGEVTLADGSELAVMLLRSDGRIFAVANRCTHQGAPLHRGIVKTAGTDPTVTCPAHGSVFALSDGCVQRGPATQALQAFEARVTNGMVEIRPRS
jgi:nitrite reductase/ring-hydroxylating ferredoxin subunit